MRAEPRISVLHQAAHAVSAVCFGVAVPPVDAVTDRITCEDLAFPPRPIGHTDRITQSVLIAHAVVFLAGPMADFRIRGQYLDAAEENHPDVVRSREIVSWMLTENPASLSGIMRGELTINATDFLDIWDGSISAVVTAAMRQGSVTPDQTRGLVAPAIKHSRRLAAYHEAAHAVVLWLEGNQQVPTAIGLGRLPAESSQNFPVVRQYSPQFYQAGVATDPHDRELALRELEHVVAGEEMARLIDPNYPGAVRAREDRRVAQGLARKLQDQAGGRSAETVEAGARTTIRGRLQEPGPTALVDALVTALLERTPLGEGEIRAVLLEGQGLAEFGPI